MEDYDPMLGVALSYELEPLHPRMEPRQSRREIRIFSCHFYLYGAQWPSPNAAKEAEGFTAASHQCGARLVAETVDTLRGVTRDGGVADAEGTRV